MVTGKYSRSWAFVAAGKLYLLQKCGGHTQRTIFVGSTGDLRTIASSNFFLNSAGNTGGAISLENLLNSDQHSQNAISAKYS